MMYGKKELFYVFWGFDGRQGRKSRLGQTVKCPEHTCFILEVMRQLVFSQRSYVTSFPFDRVILAVTRRTDFSGWPLQKVRRPL